MQVHEIMTHGAEIADPNAAICEIARKMRTEDIGALPVRENDRLIGMITDRDIALRAVAYEHDATSTTVRNVMSDQVFYCFEENDVEEAARLMAQHQVRRLPVLNRERRLTGIVALADLSLKAHEASLAAFKGVLAPQSQDTIVPIGRPRRRAAAARGT